MNETLTFVLQLREMMSGGLAKLATTARSVFSGIDKNVANTQRQMSTAGRTVDDLRNRISLLTQKRDLSIGTADIARANREIAVLENRIARMQGRGVNQPGRSMSLPGLMMGGLLTASLLGGAGFVARAAANAQKDIIGLTTFVGANNAKGIYSQLQQDAAVTPFGTKSLLMVDRALISTGLSADKARLDMLGLANAIAATGGGDDELARMAINMQQIRNAGVATAMDIKQFGFAGINIYQLLANATGKNLKEVKDLKVTYDLLAFALRKAGDAGGMYAGAMERQGQSIFGKWSTLMDGIEIAAAKIGLSQSGAITGLIDQLIRLTDRLPALAETWLPAIANVMKGLMSFVTTMIEVAKWTYHNWSWIKYLVGGFVALKAALWIVNGVVGAYNSIMMLAAARTALFATATGEATAATTLLSGALGAMPWVLVGAGIAAAAVGIAKLVKESEAAKHSITKNLQPGDKVISPVERAKATVKDYRAGQAHYVGHVGYVWNDDPLPIPETFKALHPKLRKAPEEMREAYRKYLDAMKSQFVITMPANKPITALPSAAAPTSGLYDGEVEERGAVVGGGGKKIYFNFRNMIEHYAPQVADMAAAFDMSEDKLEEVIMRLAESARSAMG